MQSDSILHILSIGQLLYLVTVLLATFFFFRLINGTWLFRGIVAFIVLSGIEHFTLLIMGTPFFVNNIEADRTTTYFFGNALRSFAILGMFLGQFFRGRIPNPIAEAIKKAEAEKQRLQNQKQWALQEKRSHRQRLRDQKIQYERMKKEQREEERRIIEAQNEQQRLRIRAQSESLRQREITLKEAEKFNKRKAYSEHMRKLKKLKQKAENLGLENEMYKYKAKLANYKRQFDKLR